MTWQEMGELGFRSWLVGVLLIVLWVLYVAIGRRIRYWRVRRYRDAVALDRGQARRFMSGSLPRGPRHVA